MTSDTCIKADTIGGFPFAEPNCKGCGKPLELNNAWITDGCPCNTPLGVNSMNETRWRLLMQLQQNQSRSIEALMKQTTPTINGMRLVTPEEAGYEDKDKDGEKIDAVLMFRNIAKVYCYRGFVCSFVSRLIPLPTPRTTRPYRRGEVKCGDVFRHKETGNDYMVIGIYRNDQVWFLNEHQTYTYATLLEHWQKLTYDADGKEVLSVAGVEE